MLKEFCIKGKVSSIIGGQFGSEAKGSAAAWIAKTLGEREGFDIVAVNNGSQSGHTSVHNGKKRVAFHLPTYPFIAREFGRRASIYLTAGAVIDIEVLLKELADPDVDRETFFIHPNAAIITEECKAAEIRPDSAQTAIASTRKGVGEAVSRKALRSGLIARDCPELKQYVRRIDLNNALQRGSSVLVEVPQGFSLGYNGKFYPYCTSRQCTVQQALADADIHPSFAGPTMMVIRTFPIRVGALEGNSSGGFYHDQRETSWQELGVEAEITTVTKRVRRVFTFSRAQLVDAMAVIRPTSVMLTFCNYLPDRKPVDAIIDAIDQTATSMKMERPEIFLEYGPATDDVRDRGGNHV